MLSEDILEEFLRKTPLQQELVTAAWPDLVTETKLQLLHEIARRGPDHVPLWLADLALFDPAAIVRYWAARQMTFRTPAEEARLAERTDDLPLFLPDITDQDRRHYAAAAGDSNALVRATVPEHDRLSYESLDRSSRLERLVFIRSLTTPSLGSFVDWAQRELERGTGDEVVAEIAREFFALPELKRELSAGADGFMDGMHAYSAGSELEKAWALLGRAGPHLQNVMAWVLPLKLGLFRLDSDQMRRMPAPVLGALVYREGESPEIDEVVNRMRSHPEEFPAEAIRRLQTSDNHSVGSRSDDQDLQLALHSPERSKEILRALFRLNGAMAGASELLGELKEAATRKRGFFG